MLRPEIETLQERANVAKEELWKLLSNIDGRIYGVGAPSRASALIHFCGLGSPSIIEKVCEIKGSPKIGKMMPGTNIPVVDESMIFEDPPDYLFLFSWHIADELINKLKAKGYKKHFIIPLPEPRVIFQTPSAYDEV